MVAKTLEETKKAVWPVVKKYLKDPSYPAQFTIPKKFIKETELYWEINKVYPERKGKYLRPTLVRLTAETLGVERKLALQIAAAMQMSEEWILISDDIEDNSDERRGKPTLHKLYGTELAINSSDALETVMWKMTIDSNSKKITDEFYRILMRTILGQAVEQIWTNKKEEITDDKYFFMADSKSAYYSIAGPIRLGAILGGVKAKQLDSLTDFGLHLGRCFQLVDDILDFDQDKKEGKKTLANTKGLDYVKKLAAGERDKALEIFNKKLGFLSKEPARSQLEELIHFILERDH